MRRRLILLAAPIAVLGGLVTAGGHASASVAIGTTSLWVATNGSDTNPCTQAQPCATLQYAVDQAPVGAFVHVKKGTYHQTVNITKPLSLEGAGAASTIIDGTGIDEGNLGYYAVVQVGNNTSGTNGTTDIHGFTIKGATVTASESNSGSSPIDVGVYGDAAATDTVTVHSVVLGPVADNATYYGIGFYTLATSAKVNFTNSTVAGNYQGALLEGSSGLATVNADHFTAATGDPTYPPQRVFVLSDIAGTSTATVSSNVFSGYAGDGVVAEAGYSGGNCGPPNPACGGDVSLTASHNKFTLGGASGASAIFLIANVGNTLNATLTDNSGTVTRPTAGITIDSRGGHMFVTQHGIHINQK